MAEVTRVVLDWPDFTFHWDISKALLKRRHETLGSIFDRMRAALCNSTISEWRVYADPHDGFAVVSTLQEIDDVGDFIGGVHGPEAAAPSGGVPGKLEGLLKAVFAAHPGRFRVVVLVVSARPFVADLSHPATPEFMKERLGGGMTDLPPEVPNVVFRHYYCQALIYEFYRATPNDLPKVLSSGESRLSAVLHLMGAHLWKPEEVGR
jgi:hypothetical protein